MISHRGLHRAIRSILEVNFPKAGRDLSEEAHLLEGRAVSATFTRRAPKPTACGLAPDLQLSTIHFQWARSTTATTST